MVGAALGSTVRSMGQFSLYSSLVYVVVLFLNPVLLPMELMPLPLKITSYLLPTGQAALALSDVLSGTYDGRFWTLTGALILWLIASAALSLKKLDWRVD